MRKGGTVSDFGRIDVGYGRDSWGTLSVLSGATLRTQGLSLGVLDGTGSFLLDGKGDGKSSLAELSAVGSMRLTVGRGGIGSAIVSGGAVLDAASDPYACIGRECGALIGASAGSRANFFVTGSDSQAKFLGGFVVGGIEVSGYSSSWSSGNGGTPGAQTQSTVSVLGGGLLQTQVVFVGGWAYGGNGQESSVSTLTVDGDNSRWLVTGSKDAGQHALLMSGTQPLSKADWKITNGGALLIEAESGMEAHLRIAPVGGNSTFLVSGFGPIDGADSILSVIGQVASINLGDNGGVGNLTIGPGGQTFIDGASDSYLNIGLPGSTGELWVNGGRLSGVRRINVGEGGAGSVFAEGGGQIRSEQAFVNSKPATIGANLPSHQVRISGASAQGSNSHWLVTGRGGPEGADALVFSGTQPGGQGNWEVSDSGRLLIEAFAGRDAHLRLAHGGGASTMVVKDAGSLLQLKGGIASIGVGENGGTGKLEIRQGARAVVNGWTDSYIDIGMLNSFGEVIVTGGELSGARRLTVGAGGRGSLSVTSGGHVRSETASVDGWPGGEESVARVSGPQSLWEVTGNGGSGQFAMLSTGRSPSSRARVEVNGGGVLRIASEAGGDAHLRLAHGGGTSTLLLQGADTSGHASTLEVIGNVATINVGENGGRGVLEIRQRAKTFLQGTLESAVHVGLPGSVGEIRVAGGELTGADGIVVGAGGSGSIAISEGGQVHSRIAIVDGWAPVPVPLVTISGAGSRWLVTGSLSSGAAAVVRSGTRALSETRWEIDGGGQLEVRAWEGLEAHLRLAQGSGTSAMRVTGADAGGVGSQLNVIGKVASINVGENGGSARLEVSHGAQTFVGGVLDSYMNIGMPGSTGEVMIAGGVLVGAQRINVGFGGSGLLLLEGGGQLGYTNRLSVGSDGGTGTLDIRGPHTQVALEGAVSSLLIGSNAGIGGAVISGGAVAKLNGSAYTELVIGAAQGQSAAGMPAGRGSVRITGASELRLEGGPQGEVVAVVGKGHAGSLDLDGASRMVFAPGPGGASQLVVGQGSTGIMTLAGGSRVEVPGGVVRIANAPDTRGELVLREGSRLDASYVGIGAGFVLAGACGYVNVFDTSVLTAGTLEAGSCGHIGGSGTIEADIDLSGTLSPGNSPGSLKIIGNLTARPGARIELEIESDGAGGFKTDELVFVDGAQIHLAGAEISFRFLGATDPTAFQAGGAFRIDQFFARGATGELDHDLFDGITFTASADAYSFQSFSFTAGAGATFSAVPVPEPAAWALMLAGLAILTARARQQARH